MTYLHQTTVKMCSWPS